MTSKADETKRKADLKIAIQKLLEKKTVGTQEEIRRALQEQGFVVNQVKISRMLHKLGAIKVSEGEKIVYRLPGELVVFSPDHTLKQFVLNIMYNEVIIVIQTAPGCAQPVARCLDQRKDLGILGTVAGDDTIFSTPKKTKQIKTVFHKVYDLLLG
jgi:transcriptional regulator of arginine metabolism